MLQKEKISFSFHVYVRTQRENNRFSSVSFKCGSQFFVKLCDSDQKIMHLAFEHRVSAVLVKSERYESSNLCNGLLISAYFR